MTLETVVNWIAEHAMRYVMDDILRVLMRAFPNIVPAQLVFPNKHYLVTLVIINKLNKVRERQTRKNDSIDKELQTCEFWRRFRTLLLNIMTDTKWSYNLPTFEMFIAQINVIEYEIYLRIRNSSEVERIVDEMLDYSCNIEYEEQCSGIEDIKYLSVLRIREVSIHAINVKIKKLLEDNFIDNLKIQIEETILGNKTLGLSTFIKYLEYYAINSDPFIACLRNSVLKFNPERSKCPTPEKLKLIIEDLQQEEEIQNIPLNPIVVHLLDEETMGIRGIKLKNE